MPKTIYLKKETINQDNGLFNYEPVGQFVIEHSLLSVSKWEMKYHKAFISSDKTKEETLDYITMMIIDPEDFDLNLLVYLSEENVKEINDYINDPMTATTFTEDIVTKMSGQSKMKKKEIITNELVYYWMATAGIPFECENWHINRLLTLIRVFDVKNKPEKKMSKRDIMARNKALNDARRKKLGTKG